MARSLAEILRDKREAQKDQEEDSKPDPPKACPSKPFPIQSFIQLFLRAQVERPYYDLDIKPIILLASWLGPFTKAPKRPSYTGISPWLALYHVPNLAKVCDQDVGDFYYLFFKEAMALQYGLNEKFFD